MQMSSTSASVQAESGSVDGGASWSDYGHSPRRSPDRHSIQEPLTAEGTAAYASTCAGQAGTLKGTLDPANLEKEFVSIKIDVNACGKNRTVFSIPRAQVRAVAFGP